MRSRRRYTVALLDSNSYMYKQSDPYTYPLQNELPNLTRQKCDRLALQVTTKASPPMFTSCRGCPSYVASSETVREPLLRTETVVRDQRLPAKTVRVIVFPAGRPGRKQNHADSLGTLGRKCNHADSLGRKPFLRIVVSVGSQRST